LIETKQDKENRVQCSGYKTEEITSYGKSGGIAILINNNIEYEVINEINKNNRIIYILGIRIRNTDTQFNLIAIYRRPYEIIHSNEWKKILKFNKKGLETIIVRDFNAHNTLWNCRDTDKNGEILGDFMMENEFMCINMDTQLRIKDVRTQSTNIDLIFATDSIAEKINYNQIQDIWGSDHHPIEIKLKESGRIYVKKTNRISKKKTDLKKLEEFMTTNYEKKEDLRQRIRNKDEDANVKYNLCINEIKEAVEIATYGRVKKEEANMIKNRNKKKQIVKKQPVS